MPRGVYQHKKGIPPWNKGKKFSEESRRKMSLAQLGRIPWNKGKVGLQVAWNKGMKGWRKGHPFYGRRVWTPEQRRKLSLSQKGSVHPPVTKEGRELRSKIMKELWADPIYKFRMTHPIKPKKKPEKRKPMSESQKEKLRVYMKMAYATGIRVSPTKGKGTKCKLKELIKHCAKYRIWRNEVFSKNNWTCQNCGKRGGILHPHHIISLANIIDNYKLKTLEVIF